VSLPVFREVGAAARAPNDLVAFRFRKVGPDVLLTSVLGDWVFVTEAEFASLVRGELEPGTPLHHKLAAKNFVRSRIDVAKESARLARKKRFLNYGPNLHLCIVTLRCNETCVYCHASRADMDAVHTDMTPEIADASVDLAFQTTSPSLTIEFQGGEPLVNFPIVERIVRRARRLGSETRKTVELTMVTNLSLMDEDKLAFLLENRVQICTSIDGPEALHDKQRKLPLAPAEGRGARNDGSAFRVATHWIRRINEAYEAAGLDPNLYHVEALLTTTRASLAQWKEVIDTFASLGVRSIFLRPIDPFGFAEKTAKVVEYPRADYLAYYRRAFDYILELNRGGTQMLERYAAIFLTKILAGEDPNFLDIRSPEGAGGGALAYNYDGKVFSSDEGRMLHERGDDAFLLADDVRTARYRDVVGHPTVRAQLIASNLDAQPDCVDCPYNPYCGTQTAHNHKTLGTIFGRMRESHVCAVHKGIQDHLFETLATADAATLELLHRWTTLRAREHFLQRPE